MVRVAARSAIPDWRSRGICQLPAGLQLFQRGYPGGQRGGAALMLVATIQLPSAKRSWQLYRDLHLKPATTVVVDEQGQSGLESV
jgi:hypothetical protein